MKQHDVKYGPLEQCQISGSTDMFEVINLGHQPPCDAILTKAQLSEPEVSFPLSLNICPQSGLAQLGYVVPADMVYPHEYPYKAGVSQTVLDAHAQMAEHLYSKFMPKFVVDIGCNDGTLLKEFARLGAEVTGVEPTGLADVARAAGLEQVIESFFTEEIAREIVHLSGKADLITLTNVFAHMADLGEVMRGLCELLDKNGVVVVENHYLLDVLEKDQFDTIYHEHIRTYSLKSLVEIFNQYGMEVFDVERPSRYGGNIRVYVCWNWQRMPKLSVQSLLREEVDKELFTELTWEKWRCRVLQNRDLFMEWISRQHRWGASVVGCSAPGRASTLLNFYGVTTSQMAYTGEVANSLKLGHYYPGCHIPIVPNTRIIEEQPNHVVLLAWHYRAYIEKRLRREGYMGVIVVPLPEFDWFNQ